jgi:tetratricopeptide (TPR) repeat protein
MQARAYALVGDDRAALAVLQAIDPSGQPPFDRPKMFAMLAYTYHQLNRREEAVEAAQAGLDDIGSSQAAGYAGSWMAYDRAMLLALLNRPDQALDALDEAYQQGWRYLHIASWTPFMDQFIGGEPRYIAFKGKVLADIERMREAVEAREAEATASGDA